MANNFYLYCKIKVKMMKSNFKYISLLLFFFILAIATYSQQYLIVQKCGTVKNVKYEVNDKISFQTLKGEFHIEGTITKIKDSTITIDTFYEINLKNIATVFRLRSFLNGLSKIFFIRGGIVYVSIVGINGIINNDSPLIDEQTLIISASMVAIGFALKPFITKKFDVTGKWCLKVIDFDKIEKGAW